MLCGLKSNWKWLVGYWFVDKIKLSVQSQLINMASIAWQRHNMNVVSISCDGAHANLSLLNLLGCDLQKPFEDIKCFSI